MRGRLIEWVTLPPLCVGHDEEVHEGGGNDPSFINASGVLDPYVITGDKFKIQFVVFLPH